MIGPAATPEHIWRYRFKPFSSSEHAERLKPGMLIAWQDRRPRRVVKVYDRHPQDWDEDVRAEWERAGMPDPWQFAPYSFGVVAVDDPKAKPEHYGARPWVGWRPLVLPEHYAVCCRCGELAPCSELENEARIAESMGRVETLAAIMPGQCWSCREPFTIRQKHVTFPGPNVVLPGGPPAEFHARRGACKGDAAKYEKRWREDDPTRPRLVSCPGCCDNPPCCDVEHLFLGTPGDNVADMIAKGRIARSERLPQTRLSDDDVRSIRARYIASWGPPKLGGRSSNASMLAAEFGVTREYLMQVVHGHYRKSVQA